MLVTIIYRHAVSAYKKDVDRYLMVMAIGSGGGRQIGTSLEAWQGPMGPVVVAQWAPGPVGFGQVATLTSRLGQGFGRGSRMSQVGRLGEFPCP